MIKALQLLVSPAATWDKIAKANRSVLGTLFLFLLPLIVFTSSLESYGLARWGRRRGQFDQLVTISSEQAVRYGLAQIVLDLGIIFFGAQLLRWIVDSPQSRRSYNRFFTTVAYGLSPLFLSHLVDSIPAMNSWICWAIGIALSASVLYVAIPRILQPDQTKAFGLYLFTVIELTLLTGMAHLILVHILYGRVFS